MAKKQTFTMTVIYDDNEIHGKNALYAIEHEMFNIEGIYEWASEVTSEEHIEYDGE